jgi:membrane associated rhomboid family serine protease
LNPGFKAPLVRVRSAIPATLALTAIFILIGVLTATVLRGQFPAIRRYVGWDLDTLKAARYWRQLPGTLIQGQPGVKWQEPLFMLGFVGLLELQAGSRMAIITFFLCDWLSAPLATLLLWFLGTHGSDAAAALFHTPSSGASAAYLGSGAAALVILSAPWNIVGTTILFLGVAWSFTFQPLDASLAHILALIAGAVLGLLVRRQPERRTIGVSELLAGLTARILGWRACGS